MSLDSRSEGRTLPLTLARRVNSACDRFEDAWRAGQRPLIEDALGDCLEPGRPTLLFELVTLELTYRHRAGEMLTRAEYRERFPGHEEIIDRVFRAFESTRWPPPIEADSEWATRPDSGATAARPTTALPRVPGYELLEELGHGTMGIVYKARQLGLDRLVALKMIRSGDYAGPQELIRFRIEGEAIARLQHPHIVQIHEVGEHEGRPFFSLEFCAGGTLARRLNGQPLRPDEAAGQVEILALAMQAAHQRDVIHRDLKPSNVLLTDDGTLKISDFGLAKKLDDDSGNTRSGAQMGTPSYMAPEQAAGKGNQVGPAADVYSLGAMLYEMLTGRPPFRGDSAAETMEMVRTRDPISPRTLRPGLPLDLETICLACLEKEPQRRYAAAGDLAEELRRYLDGRPILRRPLRWWGRAAKYARRHPARALLLVFFGFLVVLSVATLLTSTRLDVALNSLNEVTGQLSTARGELSTTREELQATKQKQMEAEQKKKEADLGARRAKQLQAAGDVRVSYMYIDERNYQKARSHLPEHDHDWLGFEYPHLLRRLSPEVRTLPGPARPNSLAAISPDAKVVAFGSGGGLYIRDTTGAEKFCPLKDQPEALAFSPDGQTVAMVDQAACVRLLDWKKDKDSITALPIADLVADVKLPVGIPVSSTGRVSVAWSPNSHARTVAAIGPALGRVALVCDLRGEKKWLPLWGHRNGITALAFSPDGAFLATGAGADKEETGADAADLHGVVRLWNLAKPDQVTLIRVEGGAVQHLWYAPNGKMLAIAGADLTVRFYDTERKVLLRHIFKPRHGAFRTLAFAPDGLTVVAGDDQALRIWEMGSDEECELPHGHANGIAGLAFREAGNLFHSVGADGRVKLWDLAATENPKRLRVSSAEKDANGGPLCVAFSPDNSLVATAAGSEIFLYDLRTRKSQYLQGHKGAVYAAVFSPDGQVLATGGLDKTVRLWSLTENPIRCFRTLTGRRAAVTGLAFTPDGGTLASSGRDVGIFLWNWKEPNAKPLELPTQRPAAALAFSPDGKRLVAGTSVKDPFRGAINRWETLGGKAVGELYGHKAAVGALAFAPKGAPPTLAAVGEGDDGMVLLWDAEEGSPRPLKTSGPAHVSGVAFSPDGRTLATAGTQLVLWDAASGEERFAFKSAGHPFRAAAFSPDGRWLAGRAQDGSLTLWQAGPVEPTDPPIGP